MTLTNRHSALSGCCLNAKAYFFSLQDFCYQRSQIGHTRLRTPVREVVQNSAKTVEKCNVNSYLPVSSPVNRATVFITVQLILID
tara:strand:+ start:277 stop:531 length:255 start_codon:yes stop_codon:yes gene_type:complete